MDDFNSPIYIVPRTNRTRQQIGMVIAQVKLICILKPPFTTLGALVVEVVVLAQSLDNRDQAFGAVDKRESPPRL